MRSLPSRMRRSARLLLRSTALLPVAVVAGGHAAWGQAVNVGTANGNMIIPDGRTATRLSGSGRTLSITTNTMSGGNAYNSFSHFKEAAGNTVNLQVPSNANYLVNIVRDSAVDIRGTLNSYKNGQIGGNVVFSDSYGFVVGKGGVVNTGSLTVVTPSKAVNDAIIGKDGRINDALAGQMIRGDVPLSADGSVMIEGRINAQHGVAITAHDVAIAGSEDAARREATRRAAFESTVNASGVHEGGAIVVRNGSISIVAAGNAKVGGTLTAGGSSSRVSVAAGRDLTVTASARITAGAGRARANVKAASGPAVTLSAGNNATISGKVTARSAKNGTKATIDVTAGGDIAITGSAKLTADGQGATDGGRVTVKAGQNTSVAAGATFSAAARGTGDGGFIEVSAVGRDSIASGTVFDLGAVTGRKGTVLFDPTDITIGGSNTDNVDVGTSATPDIYSNGGSVIIEASHSVTVDGTIDTRQYAGGALADLLSTARPSTGDSGNISITAPTITVSTGAHLLADATAGHSAGDITLTADAKEGEAAISLGSALVAGRNIAFMAGQAGETEVASVSINGTHIVASGTLDAKAKAFAEDAGLILGVSVPGVAVATPDASASVTIGGAANVSAAGAMTLASDSTVKAEAEAGATPTASLGADGSAGIIKASSTATVTIGGTATVSTHGALSLTATNTVTADASGDAGKAAAGAAVAVTIVDATTGVAIQDAADVSADGAVSLAATTTTGLSADAKASAGGAGEPDQGSESSKYLDASSGDGAKYGDLESTSDGKVSVAGALSIADLTSSTTATLASSQQLHAGTVSVTSQSQNSATSAADGSAAGGSVGVGVAVSLTLAHITTDATINQDITAGGLTVSASNTGTAADNAFGSSATSGAGGADKVGVAGALSTTALDTESAASIAANRTITVATGGDVGLTTNNLSSSTVSALPSGDGATGGKVGVGASVALNLVATRSVASIADGVDLTGAGAVSLDAEATHAAVTQADQGSAGGIAVTPVVALSLVDDETQATIGVVQGGVLTTSGDVTVTAVQVSSIATEASGTAAGGKAAVGAALALALVDDEVLATTKSSVHSGGAVSFAASGASLSVVSATASASGGNGTADENGGSSGAGEAPESGKEDSSVDGKVKGLSGSASSKQKNAGVGSSAQQGDMSDAAASEDGDKSSDGKGQASTSEGSVAVAAAIAVDVSTSKVQALVPVNVGIEADGTLSLHAVNNTDAVTIANGAAVGSDAASPKVGVGAAVAVTLAHSVNEATLGSAANGASQAGAGSYQVGGLDVSALKTDLGGTLPAVPGADPAADVFGLATGTPGITGARIDQYGASATSGAGASNVGIAGSLAVDLVDAGSAATLAAGTVTVATGGDVSIATDNETSSIVAALPSGDGATGGKVGVGASVALNLVATRSVASIADGVDLTGAGAVSLDAEATHAAVTQASQGAEGGIAITPVVALSLVSNDTAATIGANVSGGTLVTSGDVTVTAVQISTVATAASGEVAAEKAAIGAAFALALVDDEVLSTTASSIHSGGAVTFAASGASLSVVASTASATGSSGAKDADGSSSESGEAAESPKEDSSVDGKIKNITGSATSKQKDADVGSSDQQVETKTQATNEQTANNGKGAASTNEGAIAVAAAIAVDLSESKVQALVPVNVGIEADGKLSVLAVNNTDAITVADGSAVGSKSGQVRIGVGAAVAVTLANSINEATLGSTAVGAPLADAGQYTVGGLDVSALKTDLGGTLPEIPGDESGNETPGISEEAKDASGGRIDSYGASATSGAGATNVGVAGAVAFNLIDASSSAQVAAGTVTVIGKGDVAVKSDAAASSIAQSLTAAKGGKVGVGASVALNTVITKSTTAIADGADLTGAGELEVSAKSQVDTRSSATGGAKGGIAIDAVVALTVLDESTTALIGTGSKLDAGSVTVEAESDGANVAEAIGTVDQGNSKSFSGKGADTSTAGTGTGGTGTGTGGSGGGSGAGVGASLALITGTGLFSAATGSHQITSATTATLARDVEADDGVAVTAAGTHTYDAEASAIAGAAKFDDSDPSGGGKSETADTLKSNEAQDSMNESQKGLDTNKSASSGNSSGAQGSKLSVAAALGAAFVGDTVSAAITGGDAATPRDVTAGGAVTVTATSNGDVLTIGDGATVAKTDTGIGIGAAIGVAANTTQASVGDHVTITTPDAVTVAATSSENRDTGFADRLAAQAMSGATGKNLAVAGSLAVALSHSTTAASLGDSVTVEKTGGLADALSVTADNTSSLSAKAWGGAYSAQGNGVGASIAAAISLDTYSATVGTEADLSAASVTVSAVNEKVSAPSAINLASDVDIDALETDVTAGGFSADKSKLAKIGDDVKGSLLAMGEDAKDHALLGENNYYTEVLAGAASGEKLAIAGGFAIQVIDNTVKAEVGSGSTIASSGTVKIAAEDDTQSKALVGGLAASGGSNAVGVASAIILDTSSVTSALDASASVTRSGALTVAATSSQDVDLFEIAAGIADTNGIAGVLGAIAADVTTNATVGSGGSIRSSGAVAVTAANTFSALNLGGGLTGAGQNAIGGTAMVTVVLNGTHAAIDSTAADPTSVTGGSIDVGASFTDHVIALAVAGGVAGENAIVGAATPVTQDASVLATVGDSATLKATAGDLSVTASDAATFYNIGGVVSVGGSNGVGGAAAVSTFADTTQATIGNHATLDATGALSVLATASEYVLDAVVSAGAAGEVAVNVALASSIITDTTEAFIADTATIGSVLQPTLVKVAAGDETTILDLDGSLGLGGSAGVGAAADVNVLIKHTHAWLGQSSSTVPTAGQASVVHAGTVVVDAESSQSTNSVVVGLAAGGDAGVAGSVAVYSLTSDTLAGLADHANVTASGNVAVLANNANTLNRVVGGAAFGGTAGIGAAINVTVDIEITKATIGDNATIVALGNTSDTVSATTGFDGVFGVYGTDKTVPSATSSSMTGTAGQGGSEGEATDVTGGLLLGAELFALDRTTKPATVDLHGVVVNATNTDAIRSLAVSGAASGTVSVTLSGDVPVIVSDTEATIGANASVNATGAGNVAQSVLVAAASDIYHLGIAGSVGGSGTVGFGAGAEVSYVMNTTAAGVGANSTVDAARNVSVRANASEDFAGAAATATFGGDVGVAGGVTGFAVTDSTTAALGSNDKVKAGGNVTVSADDQTRAVVVGGTIAVGGSVAGVGASVGLGVLVKDTEASVGDGAQITALGNGDLPGDSNAIGGFTGASFSSQDQGTRGLLVQANSGELIDTVVVAGGVGLFAGVAGAVSVEAVVATTKAFLAENVSVNADNTGANADEDVNVTARDSTVIVAADGSLGGGIAGVAGSLDLAVIANTTQAYIGDGSSVNTRGNVLVNALSNTATSSTVAGVGAGVGGAAGAFSILAVADGPNSDQTSDTNTSGGQSMTGYADGQMSNNAIDSDFLSKSSNNNVRSVSSTAQGYKGQISAIGQIAATTIPPGTSATIGQVTVNAGGTVGAHALNALSTDFNAGAAAAEVGAGAGIGVTAVDVTTTAKIAPGANLTQAGSVDVAATTTRDFSGYVISAAAVGVAGSAATVGDGSSTTAELGGNVHAAGGVSVAATSNARATLINADAAGGVALGLDLVTLTPNTRATIDGTTVNAGTSRDGDVTVAASTTQTVNTGIAQASFGGGGGGIAVVVLLPTTAATIGDGATVAAGKSDGSTLGSVVVQATADESLLNVDVGLSVGGLGAGSLAVYTVTGSTAATIGNASVTATGDVGVLANTYTSGDLLIGAAGLGSAVGASLGVNVIDMTTTARIDGSAIVTAYAKNADGLEYVADYGADFSDYTSGDTAKAGSFNSSSVGSASGTANAPTSTDDVTTAGIDLLTKTRRLSNPKTTTGHGVIVNAANADEIRTVAVGAAISGVALALSGTVPVIITDTEASIGAGAQINQGTAVTAGNLQSVTVAAANAVYDLNVAGSAAGGLAAGIGGGVSVDVVEGTTTATIGQNAKVGAKDNVVVSAVGREDFASMAASAGAGGTVGIAGALSVISLTDTTTALIDQNATVAAGNNVLVKADDETRTATVAGALGVAGGVSIGGSIGVSVLTKDTEAHIGSSAHVSGNARGNEQFTAFDGATFTETEQGQGVLVQANSNQSELVVDAAGSLSTFLGFAGAINAQIVNVTTLAAVDGLAVINDDAQGQIAKQDLVVTARDSTGVVAFAGNVAGGLAAGIGGSVDIGVINTTVGASIGNGATVNAGHDIIVDALANKAISSTVASASGGGLGALAAAVSVYSIGDGIDPSSKGGQELTPSNGSSAGSYADGQLNGSSSASGNILSGVDNTTTNNDARSAATKAKTQMANVSLASAITSSSVAGTSAIIGSASINSGKTASGSVKVATLDKVDATLEDGAAAVAGGVSLGAGVGVLTDTATNTAAIAGPTTTGTGTPSAASLTDGSVSITASTNHVMAVSSQAGALALSAALEADVAYVSDTSTTSAYANGGSFEVGTFSIHADADRSATAHALGGAAAIDLAVGVSSATADLGGAVNASLGTDLTAKGVKIAKSGGHASQVSILATAEDQASADSKGAAGGIGVAGEGSLATATATPSITVGATNATVDADSITIKGQATDSADASALGLALSGLLSVGASEASATVRPDVEVTTGGSTFDAGSLTIEADVLKPSGHAAQAAATGASGAFVGINATVASATNQATALARMTGGSVTATGLVSILSNITTDQNADASGIAGGVVAVGANQSSATSDSNGTAQIAGLTAFSAGSLAVQAVGTDSNNSTATSGSGGVIAGAAASATTDSEGTIAASVEGSGSTVNATSGAGNVTIAATHTANFSGWVNSLQAAAVGVSGSTLDNTVNSTVDAHIGAGVTVDATNLTLDARNLVANTFLDGNSNGGYNINAGSGGIVNAPAGGTTTNVVQTTNATIGDHATVHLLAPTTGLSTLFAEAYNSTIVQQQAKVDAAAGIAIAEADTLINVGQNTANVTFGNGSSAVVDVGTIEANAWDSADLEGHATATTYGLAGAPTGKAHAILNAQNNVTVGTDALVEASDGIDPTDGVTLPTGGTVTLAAGRGHATQGGALSAGGITLDTTVDLFNNTAIPIPTAPDAYSAASNASTVTIASDSLVYQPKVQNGPAITGATTYDPDVFVHKGVNAAGDITLIADKGALSLNAVGTGKNIYLEALSDVASAISNAFGGGDVSFDIKGGSTSQSGSVGAIGLNGFVQTGLQKDKSLTISYASGATTGGDLNLDGNIKVDVSGPVSVGEDILSRIQQVELLKSQYSSDPIAVGAYNSELKFLYAEAAGMGLGTLSNSGTTFTLNSQVTAPTSTAAARDNLNTAQQTSSTGQANFGTALQLAPAAKGAASAVNISSDVQDGTFGVLITSSNTLTKLQTLSGYSAAYTSDTHVHDAVADVLSQRSLISGYATTISNASTAIGTAQSDIAAQTKIIVANQNQITTNEINGADSSALLLAIGSAKSKIAGDLKTVSDNTTTINTAVGNLSTANTKISSDFTLIKNASAKTQADTDAYNSLLAYTAPADGNSSATFGALGGFNHAVADITTQAGVVTTSATATLSQVGLLTDTTKTGAGTSTLNSDYSGNNSLNQWVSLLSSQSATLVADTAAVNAPATSGSLQTYKVTVEDTATRLGNISLTADTVSGAGTGELHAPGDASITITNETADELYLGNLSNPGYDAGHVRLNGVLTNTVSDINHLDGGSLSLHAMETTTGAVPSITIRSLYDPGDSAYANSTPAGAARVAPDIVLDQGKSINNLAGAVTITSEAGNIFLRGAVNAGSVDILAKNGDFSTSFTNTFDHVGGDPATGIPLGAGITANGAVFISARYLDINSTIQSGIVQWQLGLTTGTDLSAIKSTDIGVSQADLDTAIALAKSAINKIAQLSSVNGAYGSGIWVDASGKSPVLLFTQAYAEAYAANHTSATYEVINANNTIGATYDAKAKIFEIDNTAVHGGSVTLYGQILNTSFQGTDGGQTYTSAGQINVLDGFGTIDITNTTGHSVILANLDAGADPNGDGRGTQGIIDITDVHQITGGVDFKETVYTRAYTPGATGDGLLTAAINEWEILTNGTEVEVGTSTKSTAGRSTSYDPLAGERYVWTDGTNYAATTTFSHTEDVIFGNDNWSFNDVASLQGASTNVTSSYRLDDGTYVSTDRTQQDNTSVNPTTNGIIISTSANSVSNTDTTTEATRLLTSVDDYNTSPNAKPVKTGEESHCNWWTLCIDSKKTAYYRLDQTYTEITTDSLKADNPIGINFIGQNTGSIAVNSNSNIVLDGSITNHSGTTTITATGSVTSGGTTTPNSIIQGSNGALITSKSVDLEAAGSVGGLTNPYDPAAPANAAVAVALAQTLASDKGLNAPTGTLTAVAGNGNVSIKSPGTLNIASVTASGSVAAGTGGVSITAGGGILAASSSSLIQADKVTLTAANGAIGGSTALTVNTGYTDDQSLRPFGDPATTTGLNVYYGLTAYAAGSISIKSSKWTDNADGSILVNQVLSSGGDVTLSSTGHILDNNPDQTVDQKSYAALLGYWNSLGLLSGTANTAKTQQAVAAFEQSKTNEYNQYWQIRDLQANGGSTYDPTFQVTIVKGSAEYKALYDYYASQPSSETIEQRIADYATSQTATYHALNAEVGSLPAPQIDPITKALIPYHYTATPDELASLNAGSTWSEKELALELSAGALKTVTSTNTVIKDPNVSGQNVTLNADVGIGETAGTPTSPGIQIAWGTQVGSLSDDDKVALAAAERPDLTLTVAGFETLSGAQLAGLTSAQRTAYTSALAAWNAAGITGPVVISLGTVDNTAQTVTPDLIKQRAALQAAAAGFVVGQGSYLSILPKRPLNVAATGTLDVAVSDKGANDSTAGQTHPTQDDGAAYIASPGSLALGTVSVAGDTRIKVVGSISNATTSAINTGDIVLEAAQGQIGDLASSSALKLGKVGAIVARALNGIDLNVAGNAAIDTIYSPGDVRVEAAKSISSANTDSLINVLGTDVTLVADDGSIGTPTNRLNVGVNLGGGIHASATHGSVNLFGSAGNSFVIDDVTAATTVDLAAAGDATIDGLVQAGGDVRLSAGVANDDTSKQTKLGLTRRAAVTSAAGNVIIVADGFKMLNGATITPSIGTVSITTQHDALVTGITSNSTAQNAVSVVSNDGHVFAGTNPNRAADVTATAGGVTVQAALGIGDKTEADIELADLSTEPKGTADALTDTANPLRIDANRLQLTAQAGDVDAQTGVAVDDATVLANAGGIGIDALAAFHGQSLTALLGSIRVTGATTLILDSLSAGMGANPISGQIFATANGGPLTIGTATSSGTQTLWAQDEVGYTSLTTTGLPADAGSITVTSQKGRVDGSSLIASGAATVQGVDLDLNQVTAGASADLEASKTIAGTNLKTGEAGKLAAGTSLAWTTADIGTTLDATALAGPMLFGTVTSGGNQTLASSGLLAFTQLSSTGGDISGRSTAGSIAGGSVTASGSAKLVASGDNTGNMITATTGLIDLEAGGLIQWNNLQAGRSINATSTGGPISITTANSGGSQHYDAAGAIAFGTLTTLGVAGDEGDVSLVSHHGAVNGTDIFANGRVDVFGNGVTFRNINAQAGIGIVSTAGISGNNFQTLGDVSMDAAGTIELGTLTGANLMLTTPGRIHFSNLSVHTGVTLAAGDIDIGLLQQTPNYFGPLSVTLTGYKGGVGHSATLKIDAPHGLEMPQLYEQTARIATTAHQIDIADALITGTFDLQTPDEHTWVNNVTPQPVLGNNLQLYALGDRFAFSEFGNLITTTSYVVGYDASPAVRDVLYGQLYWGASMVRDFDRFQHNGNETLFEDPDGTRPWQFPVDAFDRHLERMGRSPVSGVGSGPAVNILRGNGKTPHIDGFKIVIGRAG